MKYLSLFEGFLYERAYWGSIGAGILPVCKSTGRVLVGLRSSQVNEPHTWGTFGGKLDIDEGVDESIKEAAIRELQEELGYFDEIQLVDAYVFKDGDKFSYHNFFGLVEEEFEPELDWENDDAEWMSLAELFSLPRKHFGLDALLKHSGSLLQSIVEDTANTFEDEY